MFLAVRVHPFPFRTRKLSSPVPTILAWRRAGKIGQRQHNEPETKPSGSLYSSLAQSVERVTVNHDVAGSSPAGGAIKMLQKSNLAKNPCISRVFCYFRSKNDVCKTVQLFWSLYDLNSRQLSRKYGQITVNHTHYTE